MPSLWFSGGAQTEKDRALQPQEKEEEEVEEEVEEEEESGSSSPHLFARRGEMGART